MKSVPNANDLAFWIKSCKSCLQNISPSCGFATLTVWTQKTLLNPWVSQYPRSKLTFSAPDGLLPNEFVRCTWLNANDFQAAIFHASSKPKYPNPVNRSTPLAPVRVQEANDIACAQGHIKERAL